MMYKIEIHGESFKGKPLLEYESEIVPMKGDIIAGQCFEDLRQRTITHRQLFPTSSIEKTICCYTEITFPNI